MNVLEIYNMALDVLNIEPITQTDIDNATDPIVVTLNRQFKNALMKASREANWSFLTEKLELDGEDLGCGMGRKHSYKLPEDLFRIVYVEGGDYARANNIVCTNVENPSIYCIRFAKTKKGFEFGNCDEDYIPYDFWGLVAYALALYASARISSGDSKLQIISSLYSSVLSTMMQNDYAYEVRDIEELEDNGRNILC